MASRKRGRPTKLTKDVHDTIVALVRAGNYLETAALSCGVDVVTVRNWMREGKRNKSGVRHDFFSAVRAASASAQVDDMSTIAMAASADWRAAAWRLEHRWPQKYARKTTKHEVTGKGGGPVLVTKSADEMTDDELAAIAMKGTK
jgi:transposase